MSILEWQTVFDWNEWNKDSESMNDEKPLLLVQLPLASSPGYFFSDRLLLWAASLSPSLPPSLARSLARSLALSLSLSRSLSLSLSRSLALALALALALSLSISLSLYYLLCSFCNPILLFAQPAQCVLQLPAAISQSTRVAHSARVVHST